MYGIPIALDPSWNKHNLVAVSNVPIANIPLRKLFAVVFDGDLREMPKCVGIIFTAHGTEKVTSVA